MNIDEFKAIDALARQKNEKIFRLSIPDARASEECVKEMECSLGVNLPDSYREFLKEFGGGNFGLTTIFSADAFGEWYLPDRQAEASKYLPEGLLAFSDDFAGGLYVLQKTEGHTEDQVLYWNRDGGLVKTQFKNILEYVARHAYGE